MKLVSSILYKMLILFTIFIFVTSLPMNVLIGNENQVLQTKFTVSESNIEISNNNFKISDVVDQQPIYDPQSTVNVSGVVDYAEFLGVANQYWFIPFQSVEVYIKVNPCAGDPCDTSGLSAYKLGVFLGDDPKTQGTGDIEPDSLDDTYGLLNNPNSTYLNEAISALSYNFRVEIPTASELLSLGIDGPVQLYEYFPGNSTFSLPGWLLSNTTINVNPFPQTTVFALTNSPNDISAEINSSRFEYNAKIQDSNSTTNVDNAQIDYQIEYLANNTICGTATGNCNNLGLDILITNNNLTNTGGDINFTVSFQSLGSAPEGTYNFTAIARFIDPTDNTNNKTVSHNITENEFVSTLFVLDYNLTQGEIAKSTFSGYSTNIFPLDSIQSSPKIRPGDYFYGAVQNFISGDLTNINGVNLTYQLFNSTGFDFTSLLYSGSSWIKLSLPYGSSTNSSGILQFNLSLGYNAPLGDYNLIIKGDYSAIYNSTPYWIKDVESINQLTYSFTVSNLYDSGKLQFIRAIPGTEIIPSSSGVSMILEFNATAVRNTEYKSYADNYPGIVSSNYSLVGLPINASLVGGSVPGITVGIGPGFFSFNTSYYYTDSNGMINFTVTGTYPDIFIKKLVQLNLIADYSPMIQADLATYRFTRDSGSTNISTITTPVLSIDPNYTVIDINYISNNRTNNNFNDFLIRPGVDTVFVFESIDTNTSLVIGNVPFKFSVVEGGSTSGFSATTNATLFNGYYYSDAKGRIYIFVNTTYGVTEELSTPFRIKINVNLNITLYNETNGDSLFYLGTDNLGTSNFNDYKITWSEVNSSLRINSSYIYANVVWDSTIDDSQILDSSTNLVRPNNQTIKITLYVTFDNGTLITGYNIPVNVSLLSVYKGISLTIADLTEFPLSNTGWYLTNSSGIIEFNITLNYGSSIPKSDLIKINATADFSNDTCISCATEFSNWIIGRSPVSGQNQSQASFSTIQSAVDLLTITKSPAYVNGVISIESISPSNLVPNTLVSLQYKVFIPKTDIYATYDSITDGGTVDRIIAGITVYLNETQLTQYNMSIIQNALITDANGVVTFVVNVTNTTEDGIYQLIAYADFENDNGFTIPDTDNTGTFNYFWLNGTQSALNPINGSVSIKNYSQINSTDITVKRARSTSVTISRIFDESGNVVTSSPAPIEVLRSYTLELDILYKDQDGNNFSTQIDLVIQVINSSGLLTNKSVINFTTTNSTGNARANLTMQSDYYVGEAGIIAEDPTLPGGTPFIPSPFNFSIFSRLELIVSSVNTINNSNQAFVGEGIIVSGYIRDEFGQMGSNFYSPSMLSELTNSIELNGLDLTNSTVLGTQMFNNLSINGTAASFTFNMTIPTTYSSSEIRIQVQVTQTGNINHFVDGTGKLSGSLPINYTSLIGVYQNTTYIFSVSNSDATGGSYFNKIINVSDNIASLTISGQLRDNYNRIINNRIIGFAWNSTASPNLTISYFKTDSTGNFTFSNFIPLSYINDTYLLMVAHILANGTAINVWSNTIERTVFDYSNPIITIITNIPNYIYQDLSFSFNITDDTTNVVTSGLQITSVILYRNGSLVWQNTGGSQIWFGSGNLILIYNMTDIDQNLFDSVNFTLVVWDNSNNFGSIQSIFLFDKINPIFDFFSPNSSLYVYQNNYEFTFNASDGQSAVNLSSAIVNIDGTDLVMSYDAGRGLFYNDSVNFNGISSDVNIYFSIADIVGNRGNTSTLVLLADIFKPVLIYNLLDSGFNNNSYPVQQSLTLIFDISDAQSGLDIGTADVLVDGISIGQSPTLINSNTQASIDIVLPYPMTQDIYYQVEIFDNNGNLATSSKVFILADLVSPIIDITSPTRDPSNEYEILVDMIFFTFTMTDIETDINEATFILYHDKNGLNETLISNTQFSVEQLGQNYSLTFNISNNEFNGSENQVFYLLGRDINNNTAEYKFTIIVDILGPYSNSIQVSQPDQTSIVDISSTNLNTSIQYITFNFIDQGSPTTGIDTTRINIELIINNSYTVNLDINNNAIITNNASVDDDFSILINDGTKLVIQWNVTNIELYNVKSTFVNQNISINWQIAELYDNYDNTLDTSSGTNVFSYTIEIEALPPPPDLVRDLTTISLSFAIFFGVGIGIAFIYEKIRYVG